MRDTKRHGEKVGLSHVTPELLGPPGLPVPTGPPEPP